MEHRAASTLEVTEDHWDAVMNINAKAGGAADDGRAAARRDRQPRVDVMH